MTASASSEHTFSHSTLAPVRDVYRSLVVTVVPEASSLDDAAWRAAERLTEDALAFRSPATRRQLRLFLRTIEWLTIVRFGRRFSRLAIPERGRVLEHLQNHPVERIRIGFWGLRALAFLGYYGRPEAAREIGYAPDGRGWEAIREP
jgi:hypothetical protein